MYQLMDYHIKSAQNFQRMLTKSKPNGQFQKLQEEYDRVKDFDDRPMETKMRNARLKRLFKEIEEINIAESKKYRPKSNEKPKTESDKRFENLIRARKLGQYFSQQNVVGPSDVRNVNSSRCQFYNKEKLDEKLKARVEKRILYGNEISNWNMHKMLKGNLVKKLSRKNRKTHLNEEYSNNNIQNDQNLEVNKSNHEISYGHNSSHNNQKNVSISNIKLNLSNECLKEHDCDLKSSVLTLTGNLPVFTSLEAIPYKSCDQIDIAKLQPIERAIIDCENGLENQLRSISNDTDLLQTNVIPYKIEQINRSENDEDNESFVSTEYFKVSNRPPTPPPPPPLSILNENGLGLKSVKNLPTTVIELNIPLINDVLEKECHAFDFKNMRQVFENRN